MFGFEVGNARFDAVEEVPNLGFRPIQLPAGGVAGRCVGQQTAIPPFGDGPVVGRFSVGELFAKLPVAALARLVGDDPFAPRYSTAGHRPVAVEAPDL